MKMKLFVFDLFLFRIVKNMKLSPADYLYIALFIVFFASIMLYDKWQYAGYLIAISGITTVAVAALADKINRVFEKEEKSL